MKQVTGNERVRILVKIREYYPTWLHIKLQPIITRNYIIEYKGEKNVYCSECKQLRKERFQKIFVVKHKKSGKRYKAILEYGKVGQSLWYVFRYK